MDHGAALRVSMPETAGRNDDDPVSIKDIRKRPLSTPAAIDPSDFRYAMPGLPWASGASTPEGAPHDPSDGPFPAEHCVPFSIRSRIVHTDSATGA
ncbi:MAG: hypothetical protein MZW92_44345 [Comamonadaceae bacterium]|nr:hypothetical protein [Comamonadaceae bacterium]